MFYVYYYMLYASKCAFYVVKYIFYACNMFYVVNYIFNIVKYKFYIVNYIFCVVDYRFKYSQLSVLGGFRFTIHIPFFECSICEADRTLQ